MAFRLFKKREPDSEAARLVAGIDDAQRDGTADRWNRSREAVEVLLDAPREVQRDALRLLYERTRKSDDWVYPDAIGRLIQRKLPFEEADVLQALAWCPAHGPLGHLMKLVERHAKEHGLSPALTEALADLRTKIASMHDGRAASRLEERLDALLGVEREATLNVDEGQPFVRRILADVERLEEDHSRAMWQLLLHAFRNTGSKPTRKWTKEAEGKLAKLPADLTTACFKVWYEAFDEPAADEMQAGYNILSGWTVPEPNAHLLAGLLRMAPLLADEELIRAVAGVGISGQRKIPGVGARSNKVTNSAVWALGAIDHPLAIGQLSILRSRIKSKATQKVIDKAIAATAERLGVAPEEVEEMAVPTYGLTEVGRLEREVGEFVAQLEITGTSTTTLTWRKPDGKTQKGVPKSVKEDHAEDLRELKAAAKDIQKLLPAQRDRLDRLQRRSGRWSYGTWAERYLHHPLVGTLARRLIWSLSREGDAGERTVTWLAGQLVDASGAAVEPDPDRDEVALWHPIGRAEDHVLAWRAFFESREIVQPYKQAHREVYLVTDAERQTRTYSNRFAAHILKQHQFHALCGVRGWRNSLRLMVDDEYPPAILDLPEWDLRAEFWVEGAGDDWDRHANESGTYLYLSTDQVRFYALEAPVATAHAGGGGYRFDRRDGVAALEPTPQEDVPALVFSEVMRDVDLFVGVASVGNDPTWLDRGSDDEHNAYWQSFSFGDLSTTAAARKEALERIVPRLRIANQCSFQDRFLVVRGKKRTYKIHLGSGNILMEPNDAYLCIVTGHSAVKGPAAKVYLPFEGDRTTSIILSKALLLAADDKITDPTILSQLQR